MTDHQTRTLAASTAELTRRWRALSATDQEAVMVQAIAGTAFLAGCFNDVTNSTAGDEMVLEGPHSEPFCDLYALMTASRDMFAGEETP